MTQTFSRSWALFLGVMLLQVGNGMQGTLLGIRGALEEFSTIQMSMIMSAYFLGFLGGSHFAPELIRRVGHVRVFAALASFISAVLILFPTITDPYAWIVLRVFIGFCFSGVYVTSESWLNNAASNETRGKALSFYLIVQMVGVVSAQGLLALGDPSGFLLFVIPSVLVSISFAPILLSATPTPPFETTKSMKLIDLFRIAPLSCVSIFLMGGVYSAIFGMSSVFGGQAGLSVVQISMFVAMIYVGGLIFQFPIGFISDRMDRRWLIIASAFVCFLASVLGIFSTRYEILLLSAVLIGGSANPLYGLILAYTNDYLEPEDMASASGRMVFIFGIGAIGGPIFLGWLMDAIGAEGFFIFIAALMLLLIGYGYYRSFRREAPLVSETESYVPVAMTGATVAVSAAQEVYSELAEDADSLSAAEIAETQAEEEEPQDKYD